MSLTGSCYWWHRVWPGWGRAGRLRCPNPRGGHSLLWTWPGARGSPRPSTYPRGPRALARPKPAWPQSLCPQLASSGLSCGWRRRGLRPHRACSHHGHGPGCRGHHPPGHLCGWRPDACPAGAGAVGSVPHSPLTTTAALRWASPSGIPREGAWGAAAFPSELGCQAPPAHPLPSLGVSAKREAGTGEQEGGQLSQ